MVDLGARVVAIELVVAAQAVELRGVETLGAGAESGRAFVREQAPYLTSYEQMPLPLEGLAKAIRSEPAPA